jgi:uncharacterized protein YbjT (DUF2867 family)
MVNATNSIPKLFITGATGNVGRAVIDQLVNEKVHIIVGVRNLEQARKQLGQ